MNTRIRKFRNRSRFFRHAFDINSGIHSTQQRVKEPEDLKLNPLEQERRYKEQVHNQNKDNTNTILKKLSVTFLKTAKMLLLKRFRKMIKPILNVILKTI